jgi:hypothetical protein
VHRVSRYRDSMDKRYDCSHIRGGRMGQDLARGLVADGGVSALRRYGDRKIAETRVLDIGHQEIPKPEPESGRSRLGAEDHVGE